MTALIRRTPVTIAYVCLLVVFGTADALRHPLLVATRSLASTGYQEVIADGRWWTPVTSLFLVGSPLELLALVPLAAICIGFAESRMGSARLVVAALAGAVLGILAGLGVQGLGALVGEMWARNVREFDILDPSVLLAAALAAATAFTGGIWRSRLRVVLLTICVVFLLYSGQPSDLYRLFAAIAGLAIGSALGRNRAISRWDRSTHHEMRVLAATVIAITALGPVITLFSGRRYGLLAPLGLLMSGASPSGNPLSSECDPLSVSRQCLRDLSLQRLDSVGPILLALLPLITLLVAAFGLSRGRRLAAWLAITANAALAGLGIYYDGFFPLSGSHRVLERTNFHYWEITLSLSASVLVPIVIAAFIARNLHHFTVRARPGAITAYLRALVVTFVGLSVLYLAGGWLVRDQFTKAVGFPDLLADLPERFVPINFLSHELIEFAPHSALSGLIYNWIGPALWVVVIIGALGTYFDAGALNYAQGLPRVRALLRRGGGRLGQWATWQGNSYWFSEDGRASVAYRVLAGVAITTAEPIGEPDAALEAIAGFARHCDDRGWIPVFYAIHESFVPAVRRMGWRTMVVGEETVIRLADWSTAGKRMQDIRSSINRANRLGVRAVWTTYADMSESWREQLAVISEQWVAGKALPEMGFTLGSIRELRGAEVGILLACDTEDRIVGVTSWLPAFRRDVVVGWTLDFMRRTPDGMNGVMEFLIAEAAERFRAEGAELMSLSTAPLAISLPKPGAALTLSGRLLALVGRAIEPLYGFRSLFEFKNKFQPELHPIYLAYPDALGLPAIALALVKAYLPTASLRNGVALLGARASRTISRAHNSKSRAAITATITPPPETDAVPHVSSSP